MLTIARTPEADMLAAHARARAKVRPQAQAQSQVVGAHEVARLLDKREFIFHGRPYQVPPVPWPLAAEILDLQQRQRTAADKDPAVARDLAERAARLSKKACHPAGRIRRFLWPLTPNPFRNATPWQVARNLAFFSMCLILDGDLPQAVGQGHGPGTSPAISPPSSPASPRGRARTASRSRGRTS